MTTSDAIDQIATALAKAQASMKNAPLNKVNPHFKSKFADLASVRDTVIPALAANGIAVVQALDLTGPDASSGQAVYTRLLHTSGQWIESLCPIPNGTDMQKMGSAITYARRYSLSAICGIAADEDDDAESATSGTLKSEAVTTLNTEPTGQSYGDWLADIEAITAEGYDALLKAVSGSRKEYKDKLRGDKDRWARFEGKARKALAHA
jgi:hypothetical protein